MLVLLIEFKEKERANKNLIAHLVESPAVSSVQFIYSNRLARSYSFLKVQSLILMFCIETDAHEAYLHKCPISLEYWLDPMLDTT